MYVSQLYLKNVGIMAAFTDHLAAWVRINLGYTRGHVVNKSYETLTANCWDMNNEASASVVNGCARKKCKGSMWTVSCCGTNASRGTSGISLSGRAWNAVGLPRCARNFILSVFMTYYETQGRTRTHWRNSFSLKLR